MTRDQQHTTKVLDASMADYLRSYGWRQDGLHHWRHPKLADDIAYPMHDAYVQTRANKKLGWP